jgi:hypothetical protein
VNFVKVGRLLINLDKVCYVESFDPCMHGVDQANRLVVRFAIAVGNENTTQLFGIRLEGDQAMELRGMLENSALLGRVENGASARFYEPEVLPVAS